MRIKKKNLARLASLSALGAGALGVGAEAVQAGTIVPLTFPQGTLMNGSGSWTIGPDTPATRRYALASGARLGFRWAWLTNHVSIRALGAPSARATWLATPGRAAPIGEPTFDVKGVAKGATWGAAPVAVAYAVIASAFSSPAAQTWFVKRQPGGDYGLFRFWNSAGCNSTGCVNYGWLQLSIGFGPITPQGNYWGVQDGLTMTLEGGAVDTSGAKIAAGDTGQTPEPSTLDLTGLSALALGAVGTRRWRAARKRAA